MKEIDKKLKLFRSKYKAPAAADDAGESKKGGRESKRCKSEQSHENMIAAEEDALG